MKDVVILDEKIQGNELLQENSGERLDFGASALLPIALAQFLAAAIFV